MSNKNNYQSKNNNHQLPNDSFLYDLDVDDWSFLPSEEDKPDNNPTSDTDDPEPEYMQNEPKQETITPSKRVKEQAIAEVALAQAEQTEVKLIPEPEPEPEPEHLSPFFKDALKFLGPDQLDLYLLSTHDPRRAIYCSRSSRSEAQEGAEVTKLELAGLEPPKADKNFPFIEESSCVDVDVVPKNEEGRRLWHKDGKYWWDKRSCIGIDPLTEELASQKWWREERDRVIALVSKGIEMIARRRISRRGVREDGSYGERARSADLLRSQVEYIRDYYDNPGWSFRGLSAKRKLFGYINHGYNYERVKGRYKCKHDNVKPSLASLVRAGEEIPEGKEIPEEEQLSTVYKHPGSYDKDKVSLIETEKKYLGAMTDEERYSYTRRAVEAMISDIHLQGILKRHDFLPLRKSWATDADEINAVQDSDVVIPGKYTENADRKCAKLHIKPSLGNLMASYKRVSDKDKYNHTRLAVEEMLSDLGLKEAIKLQYGNIPSQPDRKYAKYDKMILNSGAVTPKRYTQLANDILQRDVEDNLEAMRDMVDIDTSGLFLRVFGKRYLQADNNVDEIVPKALLEILGNGGGRVAVKYCSYEMQAISDTLREHLSRREKIRQEEQKSKEPGSRDAPSEPHPVVNTDKEHEINYRAMCMDALHYFRKEETKWGKQLAKVNEFRKQHPQLNNTQRDEVLLELQKAYEVTAYYDSKVKRILGITKDDKQSTREYRMKTLLIDQVVKQVDGSKDSDT